jgi:hypothetical protein
MLVFSHWSIRFAGCYFKSVQICLKIVTKLPLSEGIGRNVYFYFNTETVKYNLVTLVLAENKLLWLRKKISLEYLHI